jgi:hypothetical protein
LRPEASEAPGRRGGRHSHRLLAVVSTLLVALGAGVPTVAAAQQVTAAEILQRFNSERAGNGLPTITEVPEWSRRCAVHNHYQAANNVLGHTEAPGAVGYTEGGAWAGAHAVLSQGSTWEEGDPWINAPIHLMQLMSPLLAQAGFAESEGFNCFTTWPGYAPTPDVSTEPDRVWLVPGNSQRAAYAQTASELPAVPGDFIGLPQGTRTGPHLMLYWTGPRGDPDHGDDNPPPGQDPAGYIDPTPALPDLSVLTAATLTGPDGPVDIRVINALTDPGKLSPLLVPNSGFVVPVRPLRPASDYTLTATFSSDPSTGAPARSFTASFPIRTGRFRLDRSLVLPDRSRALRRLVAPRRLTLRALRRAHGAFTVRASATGPGLLTVQVHLGGNDTPVNAPAERQLDSPGTVKLRVKLVGRTLRRLLRMRPSTLARDPYVYVHAVLQDPDGAVAYRNTFIRMRP